MATATNIPCIECGHDATCCTVDLVQWLFCDRCRIKWQHGYVIFGNDFTEAEWIAANRKSRSTRTVTET